ncbi:MAG: TonB-dependent receptor [Candidatus Eremiobacteraeota bacterium]|nr:TonB-dependent receptor [Candidatus Eremiobacteraeota bacterium]
MNSTATHTTTLDPHIALLYDVTQRDRVRVTAGVATVEPPGAWLDAPFVPTRMFNPIPCTSTASIGNVSSSTLRPERGADRDITLSHRWSDNAETVIAAYDVNLTNKILNATIPLAQLPAGSYDPSVVPAFEQQLVKACGPKNQGLGATGFVNLTNVRARGLELLGHAPIGRGFGVNYGWSEESAILGSASVPTLQSNPTLIPSAQLPNVPLHKASLGVTYRHALDVSAQLSANWVSINNPSNLPAYWYANLSGAARVGPGQLHVVVNNVFNQSAGDRNYVGLGVPVPVNAFAPPNATASFVGASSLYEYLLAPRNIDVFYEFHR